MLTITPYPAVVNTPCQPVLQPFGELAGTMWEMIEWVQSRGGLGLAAPQIGDFRTYFVVNYGPKPLTVVNPSCILMVEGNGYNKGREGCYSLLGKMYEVKRARKIHVQYFDLLGKKQDAILTGMLATIFSHEFDHLNQKCIANVGKEVTNVGI